MQTRNPNDTTPRLDDILSRDFSEMGKGEAKLRTPPPNQIQSTNPPAESPATPDSTTQNAQPQEITYEHGKTTSAQAIDSPIITKIHTQKPKQTPEVEVKQAPSSTIGDDFEVSW